jgi:FkbM family methyltransferase
MKKLKVRLIRALHGQLWQFLGNFRFGRQLMDDVYQKSRERKRTVTYKGESFVFSAPNLLNLWRADTFLTKEPETLEWIDEIPRGTLLWDIGANVGLYSVYAAKTKNCRVLAFEPSVFNLELLAQNIYLNGVTHNVTIIPLPLADGLKSSVMRLTSTDLGGALSTFDKNFGWDGKEIQSVFEFQTLGLNMDQAVQLLELPVPEYIKLDVDGLEHFILKGGAATLKKIKGMLIEINDDFIEQADTCHALLTEAGLVLKEKKHSELIDNSTSGFANTYNQIWYRP